MWRTLSSDIGICGKPWLPTRKRRNLRHRWSKMVFLLNIGTQYMSADRFCHFCFQMSPSADCKQCLETSHPSLSSLLLIYSSQVLSIANRGWTSFMPISETICLF
eukprot:Gregarina_sp_Poly_1__9285@NODE_575_length_7472_cov_59_507225_g449_i0_p8_GENE_NODE_575_length_7472_cov_59_507225_g449_i0NODE_575_length_7472_cov_59_507225_g449_i0_p8_ORF_typecomplete_len105_score4_17DUF2724/PF10893_8/1_5e02DUF2724/PF10893_8/1_8_NODE_575_length_7472_cov_59_507225_g449_i017892103